MTDVRDIVNVGCQSFPLYFSSKKEWNNKAIVGLQTIGGSSQSRLSWSNSNDRCTRKSTGNRGQRRVTTNWVINIKINLLTIIWLPVVTRSYSWLPVRKLHLSALNNRYSKWNFKKGKNNFAQHELKWDTMLLKYFWAQNNRFYWFSDSLPKVMASFLYYTYVFEAFCSQHSVQQIKLHKITCFIMLLSFISWVLNVLLTVKR